MRYNQNLTKVTFPESVEYVGGYVFSMCPKLYDVAFPDSITLLNWGLFNGCEGITQYTVPKTVTEIAYKAFQGCGGLKSVTIPEGVKSIGDSAFVACDSLEEITVPASVTTLSANAFDNCGSLAKINFGGSEKQWADLTKGIGKDSPLFKATVAFDDPDTAQSGEATSPDKPDNDVQEPKSTIPTAAVIGILAALLIAAAVVAIYTKNKKQ